MAQRYPYKISPMYFFNRWAVREIPRLLLQDEYLLAVVSGYYSAGSAVLCATSKRLLLIDKKIIRLSFEDIRYESIREVNYGHQALMASVRFYYAGRNLQFRSWRRSELRDLSQLVQQKMFEVQDKKEPIAQPDLAQVGQVEPLNPVNNRFNRYLGSPLTRWHAVNKTVSTLTPSELGRHVLDLSIARH